MAIVLSTSLSATAITADEILTNVSCKYDTLKDLRAGFSQTVFMDDSDSASYAVAGTLWVKPPAKFRLALPQQTMVSDGDTLWTYAPQNQQVLVDQADTTGGISRPDQLFLRYFKEADAELLGSGEIAGRECYHLHLVPREEGNIVFLQVWVDKNTWLAYQLEVTDSAGIRTLYRFTDVLMNRGLADILFVFQTPEDVEVIDMRW
jgi:chaperone LolA